MTRRQRSAHDDHRSARASSDRDERAEFIRLACGPNETLLSHVLLALGEDAIDGPASGTTSQPASDGGMPMPLAGGPAPGPLPHPPQARLGRDGRCLSRGARRRGISAAGRDQARARRRFLTAGAEPPAHRAADPRDTAASEHRTPARRRPRAGRHAVPGHGVHRRRADRCVLRPAPPAARRAHRARAHGLLGGAVRASEPDRPSRSEAEQHPDHGRRRRRSCSTSASPSCSTRGIRRRRWRSRTSTTAS